jgi:hypothetical protein
VLWEYSVEKVTRYFEDLVEIENYELYAQAIMHFNVAVATMQVGDKSSASKQSASWKKYIDMIRPEQVKKKAKGKVNPLENLMALKTIPTVDGATQKKESES